MTKARKLLAEFLPAQDVIIEVLDARLPQASSNPMLAELRKTKPCIKVLTKADLADPEATAAWLRWLEQQPPVIVDTPNGPQPTGTVRAIGAQLDQAAQSRKRIFALCKELAPPQAGVKRALRAFVIGVPNVGKSSLVNVLTGRRIAKVGDVPAVTRGKQIVTLDNGIVLGDTPGILWPKIEDPDAGNALAFAGSVGDAALDFESVAMWGAARLGRLYPAALCARYKLAALPADTGITFGHAVLDEIGKKRGALRAGGVIDRHKAAEVLLTDFRSGVLGRISLEHAPPSAG